MNNQTFLFYLILLKYFATMYGKGNRKVRQNVDVFVLKGVFDRFSHITFVPCIPVLYIDETV